MRSNTVAKILSREVASIFAAAVNRMGPTGNFLPACRAEHHLRCSAAQYR